MRMRHTRRMLVQAVVTLLVGISVAAVGAASAGGTSKPEHLKGAEAFSFDLPAGTLCNFNYHLSLAIDYNLVVSGDGTAWVERDHQAATHTNLDSGYTLTESDSIGLHTDLVAGVQRQVGLVWHLRDPDGKIVVVHAGQVWFELTNDGSLVVDFTPNSNPDFAAVICPALGGQTAS